AGLEGGEQRLEVLGAVVEVLGDLVLLGRAPLEEGGRDAVGAAVELGPGEAPVALDLRLRVGDLLGDDFPNLGEVPTRHRWSLLCRASEGATTGGRPSVRGRVANPPRHGRKGGGGPGRRLRPRPGRGLSSGRGLRAAPG